MMTSDAPLSTLELTADIVASYVAHNSVSPEGLAALIASVGAALKGLATGTFAPAAPVELVPAVSIKKSITAEYIVCLEDGKKFKSLKRHLRTAFDLTPEEYRAKWSLPASYPMVAPVYAARRSELARASGLGKQRAAAKPAPKGRKAKA
jgi:predicted transcriptional regulator